MTLQGMFMVGQSWTFCLEKSSKLIIYENAKESPKTIKNGDPEFNARIV